MTVIILWTLLIISVLIYKWMHKVYFSQPRWNHPGLFVHANTFIVCCLIILPPVSMIAIPILSFIITGNGWWMVFVSVLSWICFSKVPYKDG